MEIEILDEQAVSLAEVKETLDKIKKRDKELTYRAGKVYEYLTHFTVDEKKAKDIAKKLAELNIQRLKPKHIAKIIDIMPQDMDSLRALFVGDNLPLKHEDMVKILETTK